MKTVVPESELSRPLAIDKIPANGIEETIIAGELERKKLAERFGLLGLSKLTAKLDVKHARGDTMFEVTGTMQADVVQQCVVSLEPLPASIDQNLHVFFARPELVETGDHAAHIENGEAEEMEVILHGVIDLGELVAQHLGVSLDPYPRKPGVGYVEAEYGAGDDKPVNPFAKLTSLTKKGEEKK